MKKYKGNRNGRARTKEIRIPACYLRTPPKKKKMKQKARYFYETGALQSKIVLDSSGYLIDGYTSYLIALQHGISYVAVQYQEKGRRTGGAK